MDQNSIPFEYKFLDDKPESKVLNFGHKEMVSSIRKIISNSPSPYTIGLFGKWGSGKSSISVSLKETLFHPKNQAEAEKSNDFLSIPVIIFDVWKHENDSLRRSFLEDTVKNLIFDKAIPENFKLNKRLYNDIFKHKDEFNFIKAYQSVWQYLVFFLIAIIVLQFFEWYVVTDVGEYLHLIIKQASWIFKISFGSLVALIPAFTTLKRFFFDSLAIREEKFFDPSHFENEFIELLKEIKKNYNKVIFIFDNTDRVNEDKALEVLATIKTFLEPIKDLYDVQDEFPDTYFIIPCDSCALVEYIKKSPAVQNQEERAKKYLQKFFNVTIEVGEFIQSDIDEFTLDCLKRTECNLLIESNISWLITKIFRLNPREIKQFINNLLAFCILIKEREGLNSDLSTSFLEENIKPICKFFIIKQVFKKDLDLLLSQGIYKIDSKFTNIPSCSEQFRRFLKETEDIELKDLSILNSLRNPTINKQFPGLQEYLEALRDNDIERTNEVIHKYELKRHIYNSKSDFEKILIVEFENEKKYSSSNYFNLFLSNLDQNDIELTSNFFKICFKFINQSNFQYLKIDFFEKYFFKYGQEEQTIALKKMIISYLSSQAKSQSLELDVAYQYIRILLRNIQFKDLEIRLKIKNLITLICGQDHFFLDFLDENPREVIKVLNHNVLLKFMANKILSFEEIEATKLKNFFQQAIAYKQEFLDNDLEESKTSINAILYQILVKIDQNQSIDENKLLLYFDLINNLIDLFINDYKKIGKDLYDNFLTSIFNRILNPGFVVRYINCIPLVYKFNYVLEVEYLKRVDQIIIPLLEIISKEQLEKILPYLYSKDGFLNYEAYVNSLVKNLKVGSDIGILLLLSKEVSPKTLDSILQTLIAIKDLKLQKKQIKNILISENQNKTSIRNLLSTYKLKLIQKNPEHELISYINSSLEGI